jgi:hypothetical protein
MSQFKFCRNLGVYTELKILALGPVTTSAIYNSSLCIQFNAQIKPESTMNWTNYQMGTFYTNLRVGGFLIIGNCFAVFRHPELTLIFSS